MGRHRTRLTLDINTFTRRGCVCVCAGVKEREDDTIYQQSFESIKKTNVPQNEPTKRVATYQHLGRRQTGQDEELVRPLTGRA